MRTRYLCLLSAMFFSASALTAESALPTPFKGATANSKLEVSYEDLDAFLDAEVLVIGRSTREKATRQVTTGTLMRSRVNRLTALEANRFHFESLSDEKVSDMLVTLKESLENLPDEVPLSLLSRDEQLAYWLNLYNFTMLHEIAKRQLSGSLKDDLGYDDNGRLLNDKVLTVAGQELSLNDIQFTILKEKYDEPVVIYGLFQGNIGGPSIRDEAYTGKRVWRQLEDNAMEFINSNRGTYYDGKISVFYEHSMPFFDNDKKKLKTHLLNYIDEDPYYDEVESADDLEFAMSDWQIADLTGGARSYGGSVMNNSAALMDSVRSAQQQVAGNVQNSLADTLVEQSPIARRFSPAQLELLNNMKVKYKINNGSVEVKDISEEEARKKSESQ